MNKLIFSDENELPIAIPSVDTAWANMRDKLEAMDETNPSLILRVTLITILMLSWLVIMEPIVHNTGQSSLSPVPNLNSGDVTQTPTSSQLPEKPLLIAIRINKKTVHSKIPEKKVEKEITIINSEADTIKSETSPDTAIAKKETPKPKQEESVLKSEEPEKKSPKTWKFNGGLQWELQIPTSGVEGYFDGPKNTSQPWRVAVPAIWLQAVQDKDMISFEFNPMFQNMVPRETFRQQDYISQSVDTLFSNYETKSLYKLLGMSVTLGYAKNIKGNWWLGGVLQSALWQQALAHSDVKQDIILSPGNVQTRYFDYDYRITDEWSYFNKFQVFVSAEALYRKPRWQAGLRTGLAFTPLSKGDGPGNSFRSSIFIRWKILK